MMYLNEALIIGSQTEKGRQLIGKMVDELREGLENLGDTRVKLCIKWNNAACNYPCALCGRRTDPDCGPELFVEGTWDLVCDECGERVAPELLKMVRYPVQYGWFEALMCEPNRAGSKGLDYEHRATP